MPHVRTTEARESRRRPAGDSATRPIKRRRGGATDFAPEQSIGYLMRETHRAFMRELQARVAPHDVTPGMWFFLRVLWEQDGLTQRELSQRVRMMEPTTVTALNNMERRGLVRRVPNPDDRRKVNIYLTERGRGLKAELLPHARATNRLALRGLAPADIATLKRLLQAMKHNLDDAVRRGGGS